MSGLSGILDKCRVAASRGGLSVGRQLAEIVFLKVTRDLGPNYYHAARFWRREIPFRSKVRHANDREYQQLLDAVNPPQYRKASQHKVLEKAALSLFGIPTPKFIGYFHAGRGRDDRGEALQSAADLARVLARHEGRRVCFKAVEGFGGTSFSALDVLGGGAMLRHPISGQQWSVAEWVSQLSESPAGWLLEEYLTQHPDIAAINPTSVNTLRVWVSEMPGGFASRYAALRIGRGGSQVDNSTSGGFACVVDMASGRLSDGIDLYDPLTPIARHPDTGVVLKGRQIPFWEEVLKLGPTALSLFPEMRFAGLDVAIAPTGPVIIELNVAPDRVSALRWDIPHKDFFAPVLELVAGQGGGERR